METSQALVSLTSKGRERFSSYLPNLKQSRIESSFTDSMIDEKIVAIDDWSLEFRTCLGVPFELSLRPKTIRLYFLSLPLLKLTLPSRNIYRMTVDLKYNTIKYNIIYSEIQGQRYVHAVSKTSATHSQVAILCLKIGSNSILAPFAKTPLRILLLGNLDRTPFIVMVAVRLGYTACLQNCQPVR